MYKITFETETGNEIAKLYKGAAWWNLIGAQIFNACRDFPVTKDDAVKILETQIKQDISPTTTHPDILYDDFGEMVD